MLLHTKNRAGCHWNTLRFMFMLAIVLIAWSISPAWAGFNWPVVKVMTQNMDAGTDLGLFFYYALQGLTAEGAYQTYLEIQNSRIPERAQILADEITRQQPDLISLQEVTLWRTGRTPEKATKVLYDQLDLLMDALARRHQHYKIVASQKLTDIAVQTTKNFALRFTDRDVILAASNHGQSDLDLSNIQIHRYDNIFVFPFGDLGIPGLTNVPAYRGWMSVDAEICGKKFRFVETHLESTYPGSDLDYYGRLFQFLQAGELIDAMQSTDLPVILAGDFNANPVLNGHENTDTTGEILSAGYVDTWTALHPHLPGFTWPLFLEDPLQPNPTGSYERIDLIYVRDTERDLRILDIDHIGGRLPFASDHEGVVATLLLKR